MTFLYEFGSSAGPLFSARNTLFAWDGTQAGWLGMTADSRFSHNAYKFSGGAFSDLSGDIGAVLLATTPPNASPPSLLGPLGGAGVDNGLTYDRTGAPRPVGRFDIGPVAAAALPPPVAATFTWGSRTATVTDGGGVGWLGVRAVAFTFATDVDIYRQNLSIVGNQGRTYALNGFTYNRGTRTATWTLVTPVDADRLTFFLDGVAAFRQTVLAGDVNGDATVNSTDIGQMRQAFLTTSAAEDVDGDGLVTKVDFHRVIPYYGRSV